MKVSVHQYRLESNTGLNAKSERVFHEGLLLRLELEEGVYGYGNVHPWPELGDASLKRCLADLKAHKPNPLVDSALWCARADGVARRDGINLLRDLAVPLSHATVVGAGLEAELQVGLAVERGFSCVKLKAGRDLEADISLLEKIHARYPDLIYRLDYNGSVASARVVKQLEKMSKGLRAKIDFLEDPFQEQEENWQVLREDLGVEVGVDHSIERQKAGYDVAVVKPALHDVDPILEAALSGCRRVVLTSYMDHPLGQTFAAWRAGEANEKYHGVVDLCGLMTHELYEKNVFSERLGSTGPEWEYMEGTGLGFDDLLADLVWTNI